MKSVSKSILFCTTLLSLSACQKDPVNPAEPGASWPQSLKVVGDGFPKAGDACRTIGESDATVDYLDDSATLVGCLSAEDAAKLGGKVVATVDGVTLVSVPTSNTPSGGDDGQGDAKVAGT